MSVDYNDLYQEFLQLSSPLPSTSSSSSSPTASRDPPPPPPPVPIVDQQARNRLTVTPSKRTTVLPHYRTIMNNIPEPQTPGTPSSSDHCLSSPGVSSSSCSNSNISPPPPSSVMMSQQPQQSTWSPHQLHHHQHGHHHYFQQQTQQLPMTSEGKRKEFSGGSSSSSNIPAPPNSPVEPPAKRPALQASDMVDSSSDTNNNMNGHHHQQQHHDMQHDLPPGLKAPPIPPGCIVNNIRVTHQAPVNSEAYSSDRRQEGSGMNDGTNCVIVQRPTNQLHELRRLLSIPANHNNRSSPHGYHQPQSQHHHHQQHNNSLPFMHDYVMSANNGEQMNWGQEDDEHEMTEHPHQRQQQQQHPLGNDLQNHNFHNSPPMMQQQHHHHHNLPVNPPPEIMDETVRFAPWPNPSDQPTFPGGLEVLWREVPAECQRLITPQDVPDSARTRGYFTVCELLTLKRGLMSRLNGLRNGHEFLVRKPPPSATAVAAAAAAAQAQEILNVGMGLGVGGAVKEALAVLQEENNHHQHQQQQQQQQQHNQQHQQQQQPQQQSMNSVSICNINQQPTQPIPNNHNNGGGGHGPDILDHNNSIAAAGQRDYGGITAQIMRPTSTPPPPYRTTTLVFKLLIIGNYRFRSFTGNPNRLKVLFNTQRLSYECNLPMVPSGLDSSQMLRKVLTIDVGFEQISSLRFGTEELHLRVEGAPVLNLSRNPSGPNESSNSPNLTPEDQELLDQIEKGELKLGATHSLYFINQRLVHLLQSQFREHPRLKQFFQLGPNEGGNTMGR